jgi:transcriptional regulator with XRE-family HTH domain
MSHRGQIIEKIIRRSGYSITRLAKKLGISRNTLYNRFENANLGYRFIMEVGNVIHYDFTIDFPEMKEEIESMGEPPIRSLDRETAELWKAESKYILLLEKYTKLLGILAKLANQNTLITLKKEILDFIEQEEKLH